MSGFRVWGFVVVLAEVHHGGSTPFRSLRLKREESDFQCGELMVEEA